MFWAALVFALVLAPDPLFFPIGASKDTSGTSGMAATTCIPGSTPATGTYGAAGGAAGGAAAGGAAGGAATGGACPLR